MKYIVFKSKMMVMPVIFPDHITHSQMLMQSAVPISAGFINMQTFDAYSNSESLKLKPHPLDTQILQMALSQYPVSCFMDMDNKYDINNPCKLWHP